MDRFTHHVDPRRDLAQRLALDPVECSRTLWPELALRPYQEDPVRVIGDAVRRRDGDTYLLTMSRQSGKDELLAQLLAWIAIRHMLTGGSIVVAAPTLVPQAEQMRDRLVERLNANQLTRKLTRTRDNTVRVGKVTIKFFSADTEANQRGETASLLLVGNEAQDIDPAIWQSRFLPMTASTNAPTLVMGTVWDTNGQLHKTQNYLERTAPDHIFRVPWSEVARYSRAYAAHCAKAMAELGGPDHPYWRSEYELIPLESEGGLFPTRRLVQLEGSHDQLDRAIENERYALLIDVAGEDETSNTPESYDTGAKRDSTTLLVVRCVDTDRQPRFELVHRRGWTGVSHVQLLDQLTDLIQHVWKPSYIVVDATGVGAGLASFLRDHVTRARRSGLSRRIEVLPHIWTSATKSDAGFELPHMIDTGRVKDYRHPPSDAASRILYDQLANVEYEILEGTKRMKWSVPPRRGHDDEAMALALLPALDANYVPRRAAKGT